MSAGAVHLWAPDAASRAAVASAGSALYGESLRVAGGVPTRLPIVIHDEPIGGGYGGGSSTTDVGGGLRSGGSGFSGARRALILSSAGKGDGIIGRTVNSSSSSSSSSSSGSSSRLGAIGRGYSNRRRSLRSRMARASVKAGRSSRTRDSGVVRET